MPPKTRTPEDWIQFLLTCMDHTAAKPDWNRVALETGAYKSGKFANQAYTNLRQKYGTLSTIGSDADVPDTPKKVTNKRAAPAEENADEDEVEMPKKARAIKKAKKEKVNDEPEEEKKSVMVKSAKNDDD